MRLLPIMTKEAKIAILRYEQDHVSQLKHAKSPKTKASYYSGLISTYRMNCPLAPVEEKDLSSVWYTKRVHEGGKQYKRIFIGSILGFTDSGSAIIPGKHYSLDPEDTVTIPLSRTLAVEVRAI